MPNHARDFCIDQFLCGDRTLFGFGGVVFGDQRKGNRFTTNFDAGLVQIGDGQFGACFIVLAQMRDAPSQRRNVADLDFNRGRGRRWRSSLFL